MNVAALYHTQSLRALASDVIRYAEAQGWRVLHDGTARLPKPCRACGEPQPAPRTPLHLPHLILVRRPRILFVELRAERGAGCPERIAFMAEVAMCNQEVARWKPSSMLRIQRILSR